MKKIKPVVIGYSRVMRNGDVLPDIFTAKYFASGEGKRRSRLLGFTHKNGKPKFRLVYDYGVSHDQNYIIRR